MFETLPPDLQQFVQQELALGKYQSEQDLVQEAVRQLRDQEQNVLRFRAELSKRISALDRGEGVVLESDEELAAFFDDIKREVDAESGSKRTGT